MKRTLILVTLLVTLGTAFPLCAQADFFLDPPLLSMALMGKKLHAYGLYISTDGTVDYFARRDEAQEAGRWWVAVADEGNRGDLEVYFINPTTAQTQQLLEFGTIFLKGTEGKRVVEVVIKKQDWAEVKVDPNDATGSWERIINSKLSKRFLNASLRHGTMPPKK